MTIGAIIFMALLGILLLVVGVYVLLIALGLGVLVIFLVCTYSPWDELAVSVLTLITFSTIGWVLTCFGYSLLATRV